MITSIRLQQFRSYLDESFELGSSVNIIVGPNGSGKTNLLEAILVLARGSSYRVKDVDLIAFEKPWARLDSLVDNDERTVKIVTTPRPQKTYEINGKLFRRLTLQHSLPVVLFEPNHLLLLSGSPESRRSYLDDLLEQIQPGYGTLRRQYKRTLVQRNALLKKGSSAASTQLFPWNVRLSQLGATMARARAQLVESIDASLPTLYTELSQTKTVVAAKYHHQFPLEHYETQLLHKLESNQEIDFMRGFTGSGPHREDFSVLFNDHPTAETASRGEVRTAVLALKILELQTLQTARQQTPLLLLDDVFSELDGARRQALTSFLQPYQTFITTTDADVVVQHFIDSCTIIPLTR